MHRAKRSQTHKEDRKEVDGLSLPPSDQKRSDTISAQYGQDSTLRMLFPHLTGGLEHSKLHFTLSQPGIYSIGVLSTEQREPSFTPRPP
jgi:hypothetical protein